MINKLYLFLCHSLGLYYMYKRLFKFAADNNKLTLYFPSQCFFFSSDIYVLFNIYIYYIAFITFVFWRPNDVR